MLIGLTGRIAWPGVFCLVAALYSPEAAASPWRLDATIGTQFPVDVAVRVTAEGPGRLLVGASLGVMPQGYVSTINKALVGYDVYTQATADLIAATLKSAAVGRIFVGWRPIGGLYFLAGYSIAGLGGGLTGSEVVSAMTGRDEPTGEGRIQIDAGATLHMASAELGYQLALPGSLLMRFGVGGQATFDSRTKLEANGARPRVQEAFAPLLGEGEAYLNSTFRSYVHTPYVSLQLGYRFL